MNYVYKSNLQKVWNNDARHNAIIKYILENSGFKMPNLNFDSVSKASIELHLETISSTVSKKLYAEAEALIDSGKIELNPKVVGKDYVLKGKNTKF